MIRSVDFLPRAKAESLASRDDLAIISITEPEVGQATLAVPEERVLRMDFHDVGPDFEREQNWKVFDDRHAAEVVDFLRRIHNAAEPLDLVVHCRAGISRSAAIALFAEGMTGCAFPRRPFAGLANLHLLDTLARITGVRVGRPKALPKVERFIVSVQRDFGTGHAAVAVENAGNGEQTVAEGPMLEVPALAAAGIQKVWGIANPPPSYHVPDWDSLDGTDGK